MANPLLGNWYQLYSRPTRHELAVEEVVATLGIPYRFQHPVLAAKAILDFAFPTLRLALEIDGKDHFTAKGLAKDAARTERLAKLNWQVVRLTNGEVDADVRTAVMHVLQPFLEKTKCPYR